MDFDVVRFRLEFTVCTLCRVRLQCHRAMVSGGIIQIWQVVTGLKRIADHVGHSGGSEKQSRLGSVEKLTKCL